jgi:ABC-type Zn uptake system ZnuABC Zn-binding protein ZnuA
MVLQSISFFEGYPMTKRRTASAALILSALALALNLSGCTRSTPAWQNHAGSPRVVVTIPALDNFVRNVGGDHVAVICLCTTTGPHHYEYNPQDAMILRDADLFFAIGLTLDDKFADPMQTESRNARLVYRKLGERLPKNLLLKGEEDHGKEEAKHDHDHGEYDPHVWLGIPQAIAMVEMIRDELTKVDGAHAEDYEKNAEEYVKKLKKLQSDGQAKLTDKNDRKIIAFHESLGYFAKSFGLDIVGVIERAPGQPPPEGHVKELVDTCKEKNVRVIAVEPQYPKGASATLKRELENKGVEAVLVDVDPLETADPKELTEDKKALKAKDWYEKQMKRNLDNLAKNLK